MRDGREREWLGRQERRDAMLDCMLGAFYLSSATWRVNVTAAFGK